jgi:hypothetical protein
VPAASVASTTAAATATATAIVAADPFMIAANFAASCCGISDPIEIRTLDIALLVLLPPPLIIIVEVLLQLRRLCWSRSFPGMLKSRDS